MVVDVLLLGVTGTDVLVWVEIEAGIGAEIKSIYEESFDRWDR